MFERPKGGERAILVGVGIGHPVDPHDTAEFKALAVSAGALPAGIVLATRARPDPKYFVGSGKAEEIRVRAAERRWHEAGVSAVPAVIINDKYLISGAHDADKLVKVIDKTLSETASQTA